MTAAELVGRLRERGAQVQVIQGDLRVGAKKGVLTRELTELVTENKVEVIELLATEENQRSLQLCALERSVERARSWNDLSEVCDRIENARSEGRMSDHDVEMITTRVIEKSRRVPERDAKQKERQQWKS